MVMMAHLVHIRKLNYKNCFDYEISNFAVSACKLSKQQKVQRATEASFTMTTVVNTPSSSPLTQQVNQKLNFKSLSLSDMNVVCLMKKMKWK